VGIILASLQINNTIIENNLIENSRYGVSIRNKCDGLFISKNSFLNLTNGILGGFSSMVTNIIVTDNNFFDFDIYNTIYVPLFTKNQWSRNYWGERRLLPKLVNIRLIINQETFPNSEIIPWFTMDWFPAQIPYDIDR